MLQSAEREKRITPDSMLRIQGVKILRVSRSNRINFGSPLPNAGEGLGVRGRAHSRIVSQMF